MIYEWSSPHRRSTHRRRAFTILELLISIAILSLIIITVGIIFQSATTAVSTSQAVLEEMNDTRAIARLLRSDFAGIDKRAYLVIHCRMLDAGNSESYRFDQVAFRAFGSFRNPYGAYDRVHPFLDDTVAHAANIWWGQLNMARRNPPDDSYISTGGGDPGDGVPRFDMPTGVVWQNDRWVVKEDECVLGRSAIPFFSQQPDKDGCIYEGGRAIRVVTDGAIGWVNQSVDEQTSGVRCRALSSVYDSNNIENPFVDGYFRMQAIVTEGVSSLKIDWSDGTTDDAGQLVWYGPTHFKGEINLSDKIVIGTKPGQWVEFAHTESKGAAIERVNVDPRKAVDPSLNTDDQYVASFSGDHPELWPKALRFTYHVVDPQHRLAGGRDFVEVISLPD